MFFVFLFSFSVPLVAVKKQIIWVRTFGEQSVRVWKACQQENELLILCPQTGSTERHAAVRLASSSSFLQSGISALRHGDTYVQGQTSLLGQICLETHLQPCMRIVFRWIKI